MLYTYLMLIKIIYAIVVNKMQILLEKYLIKCNGY